MTDRPIHFSPPMVRALLAGRKTQTRRAIAARPIEYGSLPDDEHEELEMCGRIVPVKGCALLIEGPYRICKGDRLWVRERVFVEADDDVCYAADEDPLTDLAGLGYRPSLHMPRWASRLMLDVTEVRLERLDDCSAGDAKAEGLEFVAPDWGIAGIAATWKADPISAYSALWDHINGAGAWVGNPWVAAITFLVRHGNIDAMDSQVRSDRTTDLGTR